jgi:uncharacterized protein (TIGR02285 family)
VNFFSHAQQISVGSDQWPGFTNADGTGIYYTLLKRIYAEHNLEIKIDTYNRVLNSFHQNKLDIAIGVYRENIKQGIIPDWFLDTEYPIVAFDDPSVTKITNVSDIKNKLVSWKRGYQFDLFISDIKNVYLINNTETGFELLNKKRVDVFMDYPKNIPKKYTEKFLSFEIVPSRHIYLAFQNTEKGKSLAKKFDQSMTKLRESGELAKIFGDEYQHSDLAQFDSDLKQIVVLTEDPSLTNVSGELNEATLEGQVFNLIRANLKGYNVEFKVLHSLLGINEYRNDENTCFDLMVKTDERAKNFIFSEPSGLYIGLRLYSKTTLKQSNQINLKDLFSNQPTSKLGVRSGRSYGSKIDKQLNEINESQIVKVPSTNYSKLSSFKAGDFDYMIEYSEEIAKFWPQVSNEKLYSYPIDNINEYVLSHMMCSKTDSNKAFIKAYNKALKSTVSSGIFFDIHYRTISKDSQTDFVKYFEEVFKQ